MVVIENWVGLCMVMLLKKFIFDVIFLLEGIVIDGISMDIDFVNFMNVLLVVWRGIDDEEFGVVSCFWVIVEQIFLDDRFLFGNEILVFMIVVESEGNFIQVNFSFVLGVCYISEIMCINGDGFRSIFLFDGVIVDFILFKVGFVYDGLFFFVDVGYQLLMSLVEVVWIFFED